MWCLCLLCVLLPPVQGQLLRGGVSTEVFSLSGFDVLLPLKYSLNRDESNKRCDRYDWEYEGLSPPALRILSYTPRCERKDYNFSIHSNYSTSGAGNLTLLNVTRRISGKYRITVYSPNTGEEVYSHNYTLHVQAPVSEPLLNLSCRLDGGLDIVCKSDAGDQPSFSILVNGELLKENSLSWRSMGGFAEVNDTVTSPGPWNITCSVRNGVSQRGIWKSPVTCPVPLSDPVIKAQCLDDGSPRISCSVENGTDPIFSLSVNGTVVQIDVTEVNVTLSSPGSGSAHCSVRNNLGEKQKNLTFRACPVPPSVPVLKFSCHNGSLEVSCMTEKGTDLVFSLSVNGEIISENTTKDERRTRAPVSSPGPWDVHCSVRNHLQEKNATQIFQACPLASASLCLSCLQKSLIGGFVALVVTTSPLFIAAFYIGRNTIKEQ